DHTVHTNQAATQAVSEKSSESKNELWAQTPKAPSRTDEASPTVAAQQNLHASLEKPKALWLPMNKECSAASMAIILLGRHGQRPCVATVTLSRDPSDSSKRGVRLEN
ncbi:MAG: hypothetical protein CMF91_04645, partial [Candidatus Marinimicrobia bacterium]|nr:hypothetical protein [Candidatus Neomarinimicrobiota bacterium]